MTHSALTNQIRQSLQRDSRGGTTIDTFLIHHQAGTNDDATIAAMVSGSKEVSANYTISNEGRLTCVVDEDYRAWTSGSRSDGGKGRAWDMRAITVEIENESAGGDWPISEAALNTAAALLTDLRSRYRIAFVLGHRDLWERYRASYSTFCPGPETVARILARGGGAVPAGGSAPAGTPTPTPSGGFEFVQPDSAMQARVQAALKARGRYSGPVDGVWGENSYKGIQATIANVGYDGPIDGDIQGNGCHFIQVYAARFGDYTGPIDSYLGSNSWAGFALGLERP